MLIRDSADRFCRGTSSALTADQLGGGYDSYKDRVDCVVAVPLVRLT